MNEEDQEYKNRREGKKDYLSINSNTTEYLASDIGTYRTALKQFVNDKLEKNWLEDDEAAKGKPSSSHKLAKRRQFRRITAGTPLCLLK